MLRSPSRLLLAALLCAASAFAFPAGSSALEGEYEDATTRIAVKLDDRLSSQNSKAGDVFHFELTSSVIVDGIALGAGTIGHGVVREAIAGTGSRRASLAVEARSIDAGDGRRFPVGLAADAFGAGANSRGDVVIEKGTPFFVLSPPPQTPEPDPAAGG